MPVTGLPATLETTLTALLTDNAVSSWKIAGEGDSTVVVLRLKPASTALSTTMADPALSRRTQVQYFRKKPPSQVRRDQERAKQQQRRQHEQVSGHHDNFYGVNDVPMPDIQPEEPSTQDSAAEHALPAHVDVSDTVFDTGYTNVLREQDCPEPSSECQICDPQLPFNDNDPVIDRSIAGFDAGIVKDYVASLTDRSVQRRLRDRQRNKTFRKCVVHQSDGVDVLLCESDDIVLEFSCDPSSGDCVFWYVKQDEKNMLREERVKLANLRKGKRVNNRTEHADIQARATVKLHAVHGLIQFYLG